MSPNKKYRIPSEKLKSVVVTMKGEEPCYLGKVSINDEVTANGVGSVELVLVANQKPKVFITGNIDRIEEYKKALWGLELVEENSNGRIEIDVLVSNEEIEKAQKLNELLKEAKTLADELAVRFKSS